MNMSDRRQILYEVESYDTGKLSEFLEANGLQEFAQVVQIKNVDGRGFLEIKEYEMLSWKPHITLQQVRKLWTFVKRFRENPEMYVVLQRKFPRPNITTQQLENLCNDEHAINKLHNLLRDRELQRAALENQDSFSSEDETYANLDQIPIKSSLHKLRFKDPTRDLQPVRKSRVYDPSSDIDTDEVYENAIRNSETKAEGETGETYLNILPILPPLPRPPKMEGPAKNTKRNLGNAFKNTETEAKDEIYVNLPTARAKKEIRVPVLQSPKPPKTEGPERSLPKPPNTQGPLPKPPKIEAPPENTKCNLGTLVFPRAPLLKSPDKEKASAPTKIKALPPVPQNEQNQPPVPLRGAKPDQVVTPNKKTSQFLNAKCHLESVLSGIVSPKKEEELDEYLEPNPVEEEEVYEPEPKFQADQSKNKPSAIQALPLPPLPTRVDLKYEARSKSPNTRALPKPPQANFERADTLPRPPKKFPKFNAVEEKDLECYRYTDRDGSETLLTTDLGNGAYLFRPSEKYFSTLSVRCDNKIYHIGIKQTGNGQLECLSSGKHILFDSLKQICDHFKTNPLCMIDNSNNYKSILLRDVLPRGGA